MLAFRDIKKCTMNSSAKEINVNPGVTEVRSFFECSKTFFLNTTYRWP